jgi:hypothetical protein
MRWLMSLCLGSLLAFAPSGVLGEVKRGHDELHFWYKDLKSPEGESCCNEKDCHRVEGRFVEPGGVGPWSLEIRIGSRWVKVPRDRILSQPSPDGSVHACYSDPAPFMTESEPGLTIRCVIIGGLS